MITGMLEHLTRRQLLGAGAYPRPGAAPPAPVLAGIFVIMQTPFLENLEVDEDSLRRESISWCAAACTAWCGPPAAVKPTRSPTPQRLKFSRSVVEEVKAACRCSSGFTGEQVRGGRVHRYAER